MPPTAMAASAGEERVIKLWDPAKGVETKTLSGHTDMVWGLAFAPQGFTLASASWDKTVRIWDSTGASCLLCGGIRRA